MFILAAANLSPLVNTAVKPIASPRPEASSESGDRVDLDSVNALQQAIMQRVRDADARDHWLPRMTPAQWALSGVVAVMVVLGIFRAVDKGLTAFEKFTEAYANQDAAEPPPVDVTKPLTVIVVPEASPAGSPDTAGRP